MMNKPRIIYISFGNIPSRWAHTFNMMKMAEALAGLSRGFLFLYRKHPLHFLLPGINLKTHYGLYTTFPMKPLLRWYWPPHRIQKTVYDPVFNVKAVDFASKSWSWDFVYTRSGHVALLCTQKHLPVLLESHIDETNEAYPFVREISGNRWLMGIVTTNERLRMAMINAGHEPHKIFVHPNGVDIRLYENLPGKAELKTRFGWQGKPIVLYTGHLYQSKGRDFLLQLAKALPSVQFVIAGGWEEDIRRVKVQIRQQKLRNIDLPGFLPAAELPALLKAADVLILPNIPDTSEAETTNPLKLPVYFASGTPVIASAIPAVESYQKALNTVVFARPGDVDDFAAKIMMVIDGALDTTNMVKNALEFARNNTWQLRAQRIIQYFWNNG